MSSLFSPLDIGGLALENRIIVAPMCQYSATEDGSPADWHTVHLGQLALSGAGLLILESTAVAARGRISAHDLGLYSDGNEAALGELAGKLRSISTIPLAIQLGHAGRKASVQAPWQGGEQLAADAGGWKTEAPSAVAYTPGDEAPEALDDAGLARVRDQFVTAAQRAARIGFNGIELHLAHGYLLHQFLSPLANQRSDGYGGTLENRMRFPLAVFRAVRDAIPANVAVWARVSAVDWVEGGWSLDDTVALASRLKNLGCAAIHVSTGGVSPLQKIKPGPGYQVAFAARIKAEVGLPTIAVGLITEAHQAETVISSGQADAVALARAMLYDPRWPWHAAAALGHTDTVGIPAQYLRSPPREFAKHFYAATGSDGGPAGRH